MNNCFFTGRLVREPELRTTQNGKSVANFSLACEDGYGDKKTVEFPEFTAWNGTADFAAKLQKGTMVTVRAKMTTDSYTAKDGTKRKQVKFVVQELQSAFPTQQNGAESPSTGQNTPILPDFSPIQDDDCQIPF